MALSQFMPFRVPTSKILSARTDWVTKASLQHGRGIFSQMTFYSERLCCVFLTMETGQLLVSDPQKAVDPVASSGDRTLSHAQHLRPLTLPQSIGILETRHRAVLHRHSDKCSDSERHAYMGNILPFQPSFFFSFKLKICCLFFLYF